MPSMAIRLSLRYNANMSYKKPIETKVKIGKLDFVTVAQKTGVAGVTTKQFRDQATAVLRQAGFNPSDIKGILNGSRQMEHATLKNIFQTLHKAKITSRGGGTVKEYVTKEKNRQLGLIRLHLRERADENQSAVTGVPKSGVVADQSKNHQPALPQISLDGPGGIKKVHGRPVSQNPRLSTTKPAVSGKIATPETDQEIQSLLADAQSPDLPLD